MKRKFFLISGLIGCILFLRAQNKVSFFEEHIDFSLDSTYFTINGIFSFSGKTNKDEVQQIIFPFACETIGIDSIRIMNLNSLKNVEFQRLKNSVYFKIVIPAKDTVDINIFYRQKTAVINKYIITSTKSWGEPLHKAVYSLTTGKNLEIKSFTYQPDSMKTINDKKVFFWEKLNFLPEKDFEIEVCE